MAKYEPELVRAIIGAAGHVDHGKTSLVRSLTGCETDTLPEEKARGLSIDLGFAPCHLSGRRLAGIVDVPGHTDFIRNMVAGAASIDILMLVVAADDGIMPQTEEHLTIVKLLRTPRVMAALTKVDLVDSARRTRVREELARFLAQRGFPEAPIVEVSNRTGEGLAEVRKALEQLLEKLTPDRAAARQFRMNVARVFSVRGHGTVVTGVPLSGELTAGAELELLPAGRRAVARAIQSYKLDAPVARARVCAALVMRELSVEEVRRGMSLAVQGAFRAVSSAVVSISNAMRETLDRHSTVKFHSGTAVVQARLKLLGAEELAPEQQGFAQARFDEPLVLAAGDRYLVRGLTPPRTIGGGAVLATRSAKKLTEEHLRNAEQGLRTDDLFGAELWAGGKAWLQEEELLRLTQLPAAAARELARAEVAGGRLLDLKGGWIFYPRLAELQAEVRGFLERHHVSHPRAWGASPAEVCDRLALPVSCFPALARSLEAPAGPCALQHGRLASAGFAPALTAKERRAREELLARLSRAGVNFPSRVVLAQELGLSETEMKSLVRLLVEEESVAALDNHLAWRPVFDACRAKLLALFERGPVVDLAAFRSATGAGRNAAVAMLEAFDRVGLTKRSGDGRVLVRQREADHKDAK
jgi:selenocysteine-specific elongation factor